MFVTAQDVGTDWIESGSYSVTRRALTWNNARTIWNKGQFSAKGDLKRHIEAVHEKVKYPCDQCEYKFTTNGSLKTHIKSRMVSVLTSINSFILFDKIRTSESVTTLLSSTKTSTQYVDPFQVFWFVQFNIKSVNEKVKYPCSICEKEFTAKGDVKILIESVHEKVKYPCNQCEYKATVKKVWRFTLNQFISK